MISRRLSIALLLSAGGTAVARAAGAIATKAEIDAAWDARDYRRALTLLETMPVASRTANRKLAIAAAALNSGRISQADEQVKELRSAQGLTIEQQRRLKEIADRVAKEQTRPMTVFVGSGEFTLSKANAATSKDILKVKALQALKKCYAEDTGKVCEPVGYLGAID